MSALAATPVTLVSNIDQPDSAQSRAIHAQPFTTGPNSAGYELTSVDVQLGDPVPSAGDIVVEILSHNGGPGSTLATLTNPTTLTKQSANTFTVPGSDQLTLDAETAYYVLIYHADDDDGGSTVTVGGVVTTRFGIIIDRTYSKSEDSGAATGWSIGNRRYYKVRYGDSWSVNIIRFAKIAIRGTRLLSDDATLSDLSLSHGSITVPLNRVFDAATTQYTASVAYGVSSLTVTQLQQHDSKVVVETASYAGAAGCLHYILGVRRVRRGVRASWTGARRRRPGRRVRPGPRHGYAW